MQNVFFFLNCSNVEVYFGSETLVSGTQKILSPMMKYKEINCDIIVKAISHQNSSKQYIGQAAFTVYVHIVQMSKILNICSTVMCRMTREWPLFLILI